MRLENALQPCKNGLLFGKKKSAHFKSTEKTKPCSSKGTSGGRTKQGHKTAKLEHGLILAIRAQTLPPTLEPAQRAQRTESCGKLIRWKLSNDIFLNEETKNRPPPSWLEQSRAPRRFQDDLILQKKVHATHSTIYLPWWIFSWCNIQVFHFDASSGTIWTLPSRFKTPPS